MNTVPLRAIAVVTLGRQRSPKHAEGPHMTNYLRAANVKDGYLALDGVMQMNFDPKERERFGLTRGDILVTEGAGSLRAVGASAAWDCEIPDPVCFQNTLIRLRPRDETSSRYLYWWARHAYASGQFAALATGANIMHLGTGRVRQLPVVPLGLATQRKIAGFLDRETERIDALIDKKRRLIDLLEEKRTATITQAVTKGLDPTAPMKPSNIPWIGDLPKHWDVTVIKRVSKVLYGLGQPPPESDDGIPIIRATNIDRGSISEDDLIRTDLADLPLERAPLLEAGEILVVRSGALTGDSAIITSRWVGSAPGYDLRLTPQAMSAEYLAWFLLSTSGLEQMWLESSRAAQPHLNADELGGISVPYPPSDAQVAIVGFINGYVTTSQGLTNKLSTQLTLLAEYREALITAAVTGEIDVDTFDNNPNMKEATA